MKLKKIASLALAGIMAVSMLTACGEGTSNSGSSSSENTNPATGVSATFASYLKNGDRVTFADDSEYQGYLASAIEKSSIKYDTLDDATKVEAIGNGNKPFDKLDEILEKSVIGYNTNKTIDQWTTGGVSETTDVVYINMWRAPGDMAQNVVLKQVAANIDNDLKDSKLVNVYTDTDKNVYEYDYTGSVSMQKVEDGSASAWYVLLTISIDVTKTSK
ncbi:hypothetical protein [Faecalibacterium sp. An121]|uniref:hypothetical protein n=1 Tax=Faecalibacterium sp. An121 TaxID=1965550 RepID=UPI000B36C9DD|nr:hypothetical protein [Faecalibacterium sp. An121]OUQ37262.1 hypothetical protein B5E66_09120 [Faecalibacterium sp. An121]